MMMLAACLVVPALAAKDAVEESSSTRWARTDSSSGSDECTFKRLPTVLQDLVGEFHGLTMNHIIPCEPDEYLLPGGSKNKIIRGQLFQEIDTGLIYCAAQHGITTNYTGYPHILLYGAWTLEGTQAKYHDFGDDVNQQDNTVSMIQAKRMVKFHINGKGDCTIEKFFSKYVPLKLLALQDQEGRRIKDIVTRQLKDDDTTVLLSNRVCLNSRNLAKYVEKRADLPMQLFYIHDETFDRVDADWFSSEKPFNLTEVVEVKLPKLTEIVKDSSSETSDDTPKQGGCFSCCWC